MTRLIDMSETATTTVGVPEWELRHRLIRALEHADLKPAGMAKVLDVADTTVRNYLKGRTTPNRATLRVWALRCGVSFDWLADGTIDLTGPEGGGEQDISPTKWYAPVTYLEDRRAA
jgi:transcriptional regulator with XRE-family HTH domain